MARKASCRGFQAYRRWVLSRFSLLVSGDRPFWDAFARTRSRLCGTPGPIALRFSWEQPFLDGSANKEVSITRRELSVRYGVSGDRLRRYERAGMLSGHPGSGPDAFTPRDVKRLQWVLFFHLEMGLPATCMTPILSLGAVRSRFDDLAEAAPPHVPIHRSRPTPSLEGRACGEGSQGLPAPAALELGQLLHDMGNKLHVISGRAERLRRKFPGNDLVERDTSIILAQSQQAAFTLGSVRDLIVTDPPTSPRRKKGA